MEKIIKVGGIDVPMKATAATPMHYRNLYGRDFFADMQVLVKDFDGNDMSTLSLEAFEKIAFVMARSGAENKAEFPKTIEDWLDQFPLMSVYDVLPQIIELWGVNQQTLTSAKKK